jgi:hypothetical protein
VAFSKPLQLQGELNSILAQNVIYCPLTVRIKIVFELAAGVLGENAQRCTNARSKTSADSQFSTKFVSIAAEDVVFRTAFRSLVDFKAEKNFLF